MIVVDASAAILALVADGDARRRLSSDALAAPHLIDSEVAQTLRTHVRRGDIRPSDGNRLLERWARLGVQRVGVVGMLGRVWRLRENLTAYDATYVVVAEAFDCPLVTADARLAGAPGLHCDLAVVTS